MISFEEGRTHGRAEYQLETARQLVDQRTDFTIRLQAEKEQAVAEACDKLRAESQLQEKLFSIKISPYLRFLTHKGLINKTFEAQTGYQYQLLVNGIPAFQPHVVVERQEKVKEIDESVKSQLLLIAENGAKSALSTYLGPVGSKFAKLAAAILIAE